MMTKCVPFCLLYKKQQNGTGEKRGTPHVHCTPKNREMGMDVDGQIWKSPKIRIKFNLYDFWPR